MSDLATTNGWTTAGTAEAVSLPRRHLLALAILVCVPLPALSLAATVIPLPQMLERVTAAFSTLATPALGGDGSVIRERKIALGALKITYEPSEQRTRITAADGLLGANGPSTRGIPARGGFGATKPGNRGGSEMQQVDPGTETGDKPVDPGTTGSDGGTTDSGETPTGTSEPADTPSTEGPRPDPPSPAPPAPKTGGPGGGSGGGSSGGSGGGGNSGGSGGPGNGPKEPPAGGPPPDKGGGAPPDPGKGTPGAGSGSPTEPTPPGNGPPAPGNGPSAPGDRGKP